MTANCRTCTLALPALSAPARAVEVAKPHLPPRFWTLTAAAVAGDFSDIASSQHLWRARPVAFEQNPLMGSHHPGVARMSAAMLPVTAANAYLAFRMSRARNPQVGTGVIWISPPKGGAE